MRCAIFGNDLLHKMRRYSYGYIWLLREMKNIFGGIISDATFLATNRCNSKCNICSIWQEKPKYDLSLGILEDVLDSGVVHRDARIVLTGGEFILHPDHERLLRAATTRYKNVHVCSNGLAPKRLKEMIIKHRIANVMISLDGKPSTYKKVRGVDGYEKSLTCIEQVRTITNCYINFTFTKWTTMSDYYHVRQIAAKYKLYMAVNVSCEMPYVTDQCAESVRVEAAEIPDELAAEEDFPRQYQDWRRGQLRLPCLSIRRRLFVFPNGDVEMCGKKAFILGNLYNKSIKEIWRNKRTLDLKKHHFKCNDCWLSCHRPFDYALFEQMQKIFGKRLLKAVIGDYCL